MLAGKAIPGADAVSQAIPIPSIIVILISPEVLGFDLIHEALECESQKAMVSNMGGRKIELFHTEVFRCEKKRSFLKL